MMRVMSEDEDMEYDRAHGIKQGSSRDVELDKKRGLPKKHSRQYHPVSKRVMQ